MSTRPNVKRALQPLRCGNCSSRNPHFMYSIADVKALESYTDQLQQERDELETDRDWWKGMYRRSVDIIDNKETQLTALKAENRELKSDNEDMQQDRLASLESYRSLKEVNDILEVDNIRLKAEYARECGEHEDLKAENEKAESILNDVLLDLGVYAPIQEAAKEYFRSKNHDK